MQILDLEQMCKLAEEEKIEILVSTKVPEDPDADFGFGTNV